MKFVLVCIECGKGTPVKWPNNQTELSDFMQTLWQENRYVMSAMVSSKDDSDPAPGDTAVVEGKDTIMAPICEECANRVMGEDCMRQVAKAMEPKH